MRSLILDEPRSVDDADIAAVLRESGHAELVAALKGASHALRSYQYGNASTKLSESIADHIDAVLRKAGAL